MELPLYGIATQITSDSSQIFLSIQWKLTKSCPRSQADLREGEKRPGIDCLGMRGIPHDLWGIGSVRKLSV